jgi:hypothetical protein
MKGTERFIWNMGHYEPFFFISCTPSYSDHFLLGFQFSYKYWEHSMHKNLLLNAALTCTSWGIVSHHTLIASSVSTPLTPKCTPLWPLRLCKPSPSTCSPQASIKLPWGSQGSAHWCGLESKGQAGVPSSRFLFWHLPEGKLLKCFRAPSGK